MTGEDYKNPVSTTKSQKTTHYRKGVVGDVIYVTAEELMNMRKSQFGYTVNYGDDYALNITGKYETREWLEMRARSSQLESDVMVECTCGTNGEYEGYPIRTWKFKVLG